MIHMKKINPQQKGNSFSKSKVSCSQKKILKLEGNSATGLKIEIESFTAESKKDIPAKEKKFLQDWIMIFLQQEQDLRSQKEIGNMKENSLRRNVLRSCNWKQEGYFCKRKEIPPINTYFCWVSRVPLERALFLSKERFLQGKFL